MPGLRRPAPRRDLGPMGTRHSPPLVVAAACVLATRLAAQSPTRFALEVEGSPVWQTRNDVRIPNAAPATEFSLKDLAGTGPWAAWRAYLTWNLNERHGLRLLAAPLSITETGVPDRPITFAGSPFAAGVPTRATYTFNSYRLTYRWRFHHGERWTWWVGGTAKIRDAKIELTQGGTTARKTDLGFVPLLHVAGEARLGARWRFVFDADALAGGPGRAEDVALKLGYDVGRWRLAAGYRTVEGGADVKSVYTFAWLHYAVLSVTRRF
jgi:hypothetical protein